MDKDELIDKIVAAGKAFDAAPVKWINCPAVFIHGNFFAVKKGPPMFTQKHYVALADLISAQRRKAASKLAAPAHPAEIAAHVVNNVIETEAINEITLAMIKLFKADNPKFKEFTFIEACNRDLKDA